MTASPESAASGTGLCNAGDNLLLVIDVQTRLTAAMPEKVINRLRRHIGMLLKAATLLPVPVVATAQYPQGLGPIEDGIAALLPAGSARFEKACFSCAALAPLAEHLRASGRRQVVLAGIEAHVCVLASALELRATGYEVFVVGDAICSRHRENYENALHRLRQQGVVVTDTESVLFEWLRGSTHPHFKELSRMIQTGNREA
jgi:isochorismate hydrolase